jgi:hypothetical protein
MNIDVRHIITLFFATIISIVMLYMLSGCHDAKYHLDKFYTKGGVITCDTIYVPKIHTIHTKGVDGKDSIIYVVKNIPCNCPKATVETRWMTRFDNRRFKDSLKVVSRMYSDSLKAAIKNNKIDSKEEEVISKQENKQLPWWITFLSVMGVIFIIIILTKILIKYIKTKSLI